MAAGGWWHPRSHWVPQARGRLALASRSVGPSKPRSDGAQPGSWHWPPRHRAWWVGRGGAGELACGHRALGTSIPLLGQQPHVRAPGRKRAGRSPEMPAPRWSESRGAPLPGPCPAPHPATSVSQVSCLRGGFWAGGEAPWPWGPDPRTRGTGAGLTRMSVCAPSQTMPSTLSPGRRVSPLWAEGCRADCWPAGLGPSGASFSSPHPLHLGGAGWAQEAEGLVWVTQPERDWAGTPGACLPSSAHTGAIFLVASDKGWPSAPWQAPWCLCCWGGRSGLCSPCQSWGGTPAGVPRTPAAQTPPPPPGTWC